MRLFLLALLTIALSGSEWPAVPGAVFASRTAHFNAPAVVFADDGRPREFLESVWRDRARVGRNYEWLCDGGSFQFRDGNAFIATAVARTGAFTIEATITPLEIPAATTGTIISYGKGDLEHVSLVQQGATLALRLGSAAPLPMTTLAADVRVQVVVACAAGAWRLFRDGLPAGDGMLPAVAAWTPAKLTIGATDARTEPWRGRVEGVALYARALTAEDAVRQVAATVATARDVPPTTSVRFRGTLIQQATTPATTRLGTYSRVLTASEYRITGMIAGNYAQPTIRVFHWAILNRTRLPLADRQPGSEHEMTVSPFADQPHLKAELQANLDDAAEAPLYYSEGVGQP